MPKRRYDGRFGRAPFVDSRVRRLLGAALQGFSRRGRLDGAVGAPIRFAGCCFWGHFEPAVCLLFAIPILRAIRLWRSRPQPPAGRDVYIGKQKALDAYVASSAFLVGLRWPSVHAGLRCPMSPCVLAREGLRRHRF